ncbi:MAG: hypothetical protein ACKOEL_05570 [Planctomycetota bacterium]
MSKLCIPSVAVAAILLSHSAVAAVVLAGWDTSGAAGWGPSPFAPTVSAAGVSVVGLTRGPGLGTGGTAYNNAWGAAGWAMAGGPGAQTRANATTNGKFITFSLTVAAGFTMSLETIDPIRYQRDGNGPRSGALEYQVNGGAFTTAAAGISYAAGQGQSVSAISLTGIAALQNLGEGTTVTFRLVNWGGTNQNDGGRWAFNNGIADGNDLAVNGTVTAVPAPGAIALLGAAGLIGSVRRRA